MDDSFYQAEMPISTSAQFTVKMPSQTINQNQASRPDLFNTTLFEEETSVYNVINPGIGHKTISSKNQPLNAIAIKTKRAASLRPKHVVKPSLAPGRQPIGLGVTSILNKKPLSDFQAPKTPELTQFQKQEETQRAGLISEDPVAYFTKHKDFSGQRFLYLVYARDPNDPQFNPYELRKVAYCDITPNHFTMSASGVAHISAFGETES